MIVKCIRVNGNLLLSINLVEIEESNLALDQMKSDKVNQIKKNDKELIWGLWGNKLSLNKIIIN